jgi:hypothetical protein
MGSADGAGLFFAAALQLEAIVSGEFEAIRVELKYCEACGALRLRPRGSNTPYCRHCEEIMAGLSRAAGKKPAEGERP